MAGSEKIERARRNLDQLSGFKATELQLFETDYLVDAVLEVVHELSNKEQWLFFQAILAIFIQTKRQDLHSELPRLIELLMPSVDKDAVEQQRVELLAKAEAAANLAESENPWQFCMTQTEPTFYTPYVVGYYQDEAGVIAPIYGSKFFKSKRRLPDNGWSWMVSHNEYKEMSLLEGEFITVDQHQVIKGSYWEALPVDFRKKIESGTIFLTSDAFEKRFKSRKMFEAANDLYQVTSEDIVAMTQNLSADIVQKMVQQKVQQSYSEGNKYGLLYFGEYIGDKVGRTAVVIQFNQDGSFEPVKAVIQGKEYVLEAKGCGTKSGGFGDMQFRTGKQTLGGSVEKNQAEQELLVLEESTEKLSSHAAGIVIFEGRRQDQGYILRFVPSTVRGSYTGDSAFPDIEEKKNVRALIKTYVSLFVEQLFTQNSKIISRSSHTENIMVLGDGRFEFTDYSDQRFLSDSSLPHNDNHSYYLSIKKLLWHYVKMIEEIPGYSAKTGKRLFYAELNKQFLKKGLELNLEAAADYDVAIEKIWNTALAWKTYEARREHGYQPLGVVNDITEMLFGEYAVLAKYIFLKSKKKFINERVNKNEEQKQYLYSLFFGQCEKYFEHEQDLIQAALNSPLSKDSREELHEVLRQIEQRQSELQGLWEDHSKLYQILTNKELLKSFLSFV